MKHWRNCMVMEKVTNDGKNQIYKSMLMGYNSAALKALQEYVIEGSFNPDDIGEDEVILSVLRIDDTKIMRCRDFTKREYL